MNGTFEVLLHSYARTVCNLCTVSINWRLPNNFFCHLSITCQMVASLIRQQQQAAHLFPHVWACQLVRPQKDASAWSGFGFYCLVRPLDNSMYTSDRLKHLPTTGRGFPSPCLFFPSLFFLSFDPPPVPNNLFLLLFPVSKSQVTVTVSVSVSHPFQVIFHPSSHRVTTTSHPLHFSAKLSFAGLPPPCSTPTQSVSASALLVHIPHATYLIYHHNVGTSS